MPSNLLDKATEAMLNKAVHSELYASHLYRHVSNQMQRLGFDELTHYQRIADYMNDRGTSAQIPMLEACTEKLTGIVDAIELGYETELQLMNDYENWYRNCDCVITQQFLLQFLEIQRKSVGEYGDLQARLKIVADDSCGLLIIDKELGNG